MCSVVLTACAQTDLDGKLNARVVMMMTTRHCLWVLVKRVKYFSSVNEQEDAMRKRYVRLSAYA
jgi:hypothetical protein